MDNQNIATYSGPKKWQSWLVLFLRWLLGAIAGYIIGFILLIITERINPPLLEPIIAGQQELFEGLIFYMFYDDAKSFDLILDVSLFVYCTIWGLIGALPASARKKQTKAGVILLILYIIVGFLSYVIWAIRMIPT